MNKSSIADKNYRVPNGKNSCNLRFSTPEPANAGVGIDFHVVVPKNGEKDDEVRILGLHKGETLTARINELYPVASSVLQIRVRIYVERLFREMMADLFQKAEASLKQKGY